MPVLESGEAKSDILKGSWQDRACKCADDEKHALWEPGSTEPNILNDQPNSSNAL